jgi:hypothetical protein
MNNKKTFAFKLAKKTKEKSDTKWKMRDGVSRGACTDGSLGTYFKINGNDLGHPC